MPAVNPPDVRTSAPAMSAGASRALADSQPVAIGPAGQTRGPSIQSFIRALTGYPGAAILLALYFVMAITATLDKTAAYDETFHLASGISRWKTGLAWTENGTLPERWATFPLILAGVHPPATRGPGWGADWDYGYSVLFESGNNPARLLLAGRSMIALLSIADGLLVYAWSRRLFGRAGGIVSLTLFSFSPLMLSHGALITSDAAAALFFLAAVAALWTVLHRLTPATLLLSFAMAGALFLSKVSAVLLVPMALLLAAIRIARGHPWPVRLGGFRESIASRNRQTAIAALLVVSHAMAICLIIWIGYGFRDSPEPPKASSAVPSTADDSIAGDVLWGMRDLRLLPEDYVNGILGVQGISEGRAAFAAGSEMRRAWAWFFPYCLAVKTPIPTLLIVLMAATAAAARLARGAGEPPGSSLVPDNSKIGPRPGTKKGKAGREPSLSTASKPSSNDFNARKRKIARPDAQGSTPAGAYRDRLLVWSALSPLLQSLYAAAPLWVLLIVYWASALSSDLNIGIRHIMPVFPPMYVLAGAAAYWLDSRRRIGAAVVCGAIGWLVVESLAVRPDYIAYFNELVGGPDNGYKCLIDSSLDWGQDLPGLRKWLDRNGLNARPTDSSANAAAESANRPGAAIVSAQKQSQAEPRVYLSYFGTASPGYYGIHATLLPCMRESADDRAGVLEPLHGGVYCVSASTLQLYHFPVGPWTRRFEYAYRRMLEEYKADKARTGVEDADERADIRTVRFARLCAFLRHREPDAEIGHSILIYRLSEADADVATTGDPSAVLEEPR